MIERYKVSGTKSKRSCLSLMSELHFAYIIHSRSFTDSKILIELLSSQLGRTKVVARKPTKKNRSQFQTFQLLEVALKGTSELKTLIYCEAPPIKSARPKLQGTSLFCAMYINEILQRLLPLEEPDQMLFDAYEQALVNLATATDVSGREVALRVFELNLLSVLGYAIDFGVTSAGEPIAVDKYYTFKADIGFIEQGLRFDESSISGSILRSIEQSEFVPVESLVSAKRITRAALLPLLGQRPLKSRELFK